MIKNKRQSWVIKDLDQDLDQISPDLSPINRGHPVWCMRISRGKKVCLYVLIDHLYLSVPLAPCKRQAVRNYPLNARGIGGE